MSPPPEDSLARLRRVLGSPALTALRQRLRRAYEQASTDAEPRLLRLSRLAPHEAEALQTLTGRPPRQVASLQIDLAEIGQSLRTAGVADDLRGALELLDGPIAARAADRAASAAAWAALPERAQQPPLAELMARPQGLGLLKRLSGGSAAAAGDLCERAEGVLARLPARGEPRAALAARSLGDAHALDDGQPVATLLLAAWRLQRTDGESEDGPRALWAAQGVAVNELARPALALNLPLRGEAADGEPRYWSLRELLRRPPHWQVAGRPVFVCENPNLLALAADALGPGCAPLVCTEGMPAAAQRVLLQQLSAAGAQLRYHGDFDWPGMRIAQRVLHDFGAQPWRFGTGDYLAALALLGDSAAPLAGLPAPVPWDDALGAAMQRAGRALHEEALWAQLRDDLRG